MHPATVVHIFPVHSILDVRIAASNSECSEFGFFGEGLRRSETRDDAWLERVTRFVDALAWADARLDLAWFFRDEPF